MCNVALGHGLELTLFFALTEWKSEVLSEDRSKYSSAYLFKQKDDVTDIEYPVRTHVVGIYDEATATTASSCNNPTWFSPAGIAL